MARGRNRIYFAIAFAISSIPALVAIYAFKHQLTVLSSFLFALSIISMGISTFIFLSYKTVKHGTPLVLSTLANISQSLAPMARFLSKTIILGPLFSLIIRIGFFLSFVILLMSDQLIRIVFGLFIGRHPSKRTYSITCAMDPRIEFFDDTIPRTRHLENSELFKQRKQIRMKEENGMSGALTSLMKRPKYSVPLAYTLSVASKLVYEDVEVIKYELKKAGFDVENTFRPIAYKNICAFIAEKEDDILLVFRGTNPLNIQNYLTNITMSMASVKSSWGPMGRVHKGFWKAMGEPMTKKTSSVLKKRKSLSSTDIATNNKIGQEGPILRIELTNTSIYRTIMSTIQAIVKILKFLTTNLFYHVKEPIDHSWVGPDTDIRTNSMYALAEEHILNLIHLYEDNNNNKRNKRRMSGLLSQEKADKPKKKRLFITGHSLGGALGTIFLAKMLQTKSPLLDYFAGLYTYGQPKIGDAEFSKVFSPHMTSKIFHHVYNNDVVPRLLNFWDYYTPPGSLVYIDSAFNITIYPPNPYTNEPVPVRPISFLHLSGLLNRYVIRRLPRENRIRILFRILFPFFLNDHFPCDYSESLRHGQVQWVIMGADGLEGGSEEQQQNMTKYKRRYSIINVHD
ncbi:Alpha/Beta hydrolase protein [Cokeromyces recurvatus]|uniref:Alpha/Beta hydrolase protein n=1 Tax=Cokeromyces recurvatus TaxID=90255 RepID=UPI00221F8A3B|nr:Alpha/Beta hydrolase protein [Cokeromyces recurvatus]KAI7907924.1 Alpha/Beta hydrolase protein [Cokeromyces recurvatus]